MTQIRTQEAQKIVGKTQDTTVERSTLFSAFNVWTEELGYPPSNLYTTRFGVVIDRNMFSIVRRESSGGTFMMSRF
jgi:hypothetical protein